VALKFFPGQPGKIVAVASTAFSALYLTKFQGFGAWGGLWSFFEAEFERDPHRTDFAIRFFKELKCYKNFKFHGRQQERRG